MTKEPRKRDEAHAMVAVHERMHSQDARIEGSHSPRPVQKTCRIWVAERVCIPVEGRADCLEFTIDRLGGRALQLPHPAIWDHHAEECPVAAEAPSVMRKVAGEDRSVPPSDALWVHPQRGSPERSLRVIEDAGEFVSEGLPGLLGREVACLIEARLLAVAVTRLGNVHLCEDASGLGPSRHPNRAHRLLDLSGGGQTLPPTL